MTSEIGEWLNGNAGSIQAVSTGVLVAITAVYAWLTWSIAKEANAQNRARREEAQARQRLLESDVHFLGEILEALPGPTTNPSQMQTSLINYPHATWDDFDFRDFRKLASEVSHSAGRSASIVEARMKLLARDLRLIMSAPNPIVGFDWNKFDWRIWNNSLEEARQALADIKGSLTSPVGASRSRNQLALPSTKGGR